MKILTSNFFSKKENNRIKNDGILFENLIKELLDLEFGHLDWERTKTTWDGAKDFIGKKKGTTDVWAECKIHNHNLELAAISKTMVMAINYNINKIIIFSWSKLNTNTIKELANFSSVSETQIHVFDDELLEILILKYINKESIKGFFPEVVLPLSQELLCKPEIKQFFSTEIQLDSSQKKDDIDKFKTRNNEVQINSPCLFQITISPKKIEPTKIVIDLSQILKREYELGILNKEKLNIDKNGNILKTITPGEIYSIRIYFAPSKSGSQEIPTCSIFIGHEKKQTASVKFNVNKLRRPNLVGAGIKQALINFCSKISSNNHVYTVAISGLSGVGKSRFLEECISELLKENYRICKLDGKTTQCKNINHFAVELLTQLWRLPNPEVFKEEFTSLRIATLGEDNYNTYSGLYEIIRICTFSDQTLSNEIEEKIHHFLIKGFLTQDRIAILIDNIQSLDNKSIALVRRLAEQTGKIAQNVSLFTFNIEELIYSHEAASFYQNLKEQLTEDSNGLFFPINEFSENEVKQFVNTHLKSISNEGEFSQQYPLLFQLICEHIQPRPLDLFQFFQLIYDEKDTRSIEIDDGIFYIDDFEKFNTTLRGVGKKIKDILTQRLNKLSKDIASLDLLILLLYFGEIDIDSLIAKLGFEYETIENLVNRCWLKILPDQKVTFYHPKIERFIIEKELSLLRNRGTGIFKRLNSCIDLTQYPLINFSLNPSKDKIVVEAINQLLGLTTLNARNKLFATKIYNYITSPFSHVNPSVYLKAVQKICKLIAENNSIVTIEKLSDFNKILNDYTPKESEAVPYFQAIRQLASYLCTNDPYKSISIINDGLSKLSSFKENFSEKTADYIQMNLKNRLSICYNTIRNQEKAKEIGEDALNIAKKINNIPFICLCYVDLGNIFRGLTKNKNKLIEYWDEAIKFYNHNKKVINKEDITIALAAMEAEAYLYAIKSMDYDKAIIKAEEMISLSKEHFYMHSEKSGILSKTIFEIKLNPYAFEKIIPLTDSLIDRCLISYDYKNQSKGYHLKAITLSRQEGKDGETYTYFKYGLKILAKKEYLSASDEALICDAAFFSKRQKYSGEDMDFSYIILNKMKKADNLTKFLEKGVDPNLFMLFADGEYNLPV